MKRFLFILLFFLSSTLYADTLSLQLAKPPELQPIKDQSEIESNEALYKILYENSKMNYDTLYNFWKWAVAIIVTLFIAMITGAGALVYLFNHRKYDRLNEEIQKQLAQSNNKIKEFEKINETTSDMYQEFKERNKDILKSYRSEIDTRIKSTDKELTSVKDDLFKFKKIFRDKDFLSVAKFHEERANNCFVNKDNHAALVEFLSMGKVLTQVGYDCTKLNDCLIGIDKSLDGMIKLDLKISKHLKKMLTDFIDLLDLMGDYAISTEGLLAKLNSVGVSGGGSMV